MTATTYATAGRTPSALPTEAELAEMLAARAPEVAALLYPNGKRVGNEWVCGDKYGAPAKRNGSFRICLTGDKAGLCKDFATDERGFDLLDAWRLGCNGDRNRLRAEVAAFLGIPEPTAPPSADRQAGFRAERIARLESNLRALTWLANRGIAEATRHAFLLGLTTPYFDRLGIEHRDALVASVMQRDGTPSNRCLYYNIPGLSLNPAADNGWMKGQPMTYHGGAYAGQHAAFVIEGIKDLWRMHSALLGTPLSRRIHLLSSTHGSAVPAEWADPEFWSDFDTIYLGHDRDPQGQGDAIAERVATTIGRRVRRVRIPDRILRHKRPEGAGPPKDWTDYWNARGASVEEFQELLDRAPLMRQEAAAHVPVWSGTENAKQREAADAAHSVRPQQTAEMPPWLLDQAPGIVRIMLDWAIETAVRPQPQLLLQAVWATCSTAAGRGYCANRGRTWPSLWFLNLGSSGAGKDHGHAAATALLEAGGALRRVGAGGYTSAGAVISALIEKPAHLSLIDELSRVLHGARANTNAHRHDGLTQLMSLFGNCHTRTLASAYSAMSAGMTAEHRKALVERYVQRPAVTLLGLATPDSFWTVLNEELVRSGFLNRWLVCESALARCDARFDEDAEEVLVPAAAADWIATVVPERETPADEIPAPVRLRFDGLTSEAARAFDRDCNRRMADLDESGYAVLLARTWEKALRLALLVALAEDPGARTIRASDFEYASAYALALDLALLESVRIHVGGSDFARLRNACAQRLAKAGPRGMTRREMGRDRVFAGLRPREQEEILGALSDAGLIEFRTLRTGGRSREAWIAVEADEES